jgi:preprotein translocase SecE subunit
MAISRIKEDNLVESNLSSKVVTDVKSKDLPENNNTEKDEFEKKKKLGFFASVLDELSKVSWPSLDYVFKWTGIIILFTMFFSLILGFADHVFSSGITLVDCTAPSGRGQPFDTCLSETIDELTFNSTEVE